MPDSDPLGLPRLLTAPIFHRDRQGPWIQFGSAAGFEWNRAELPIPGLPDDLAGLRILHLTDLHARRRWDVALDELIERVRKSPPDLIIFTGDFVDDRHHHMVGMPVVRRLFQQLTSRLGTIAILGNHDGDLVGPPVAALNLTMVDQRRLSLHSGSATLEIIGVAGVDRKDLDPDFLRSIGAKPPNTLRIVLSHFPNIIRRVGLLEGDLFLCGHTHGGQICLPNRRPIFRHDSLPHRLCTGIHRAFDTWLVANRGLGFSSPVPLRVFCPAEVIEIVLRQGSAE